MNLFTASQPGKFLLIVERPPFACSTQNSHSYGRGSFDDELPCCRHQLLAVDSTESNASSDSLAKRL